MSIPINPTNGFLAVTPHGYARAASVSIRRSDRPTGLALQQKASRVSRPTTVTSRDIIIAELDTKTRDLNKSITEFEFPSGNIPRHIRTAISSDPKKATAHAEPRATTASYTLDIDRLAATKKIQSTVLVSNDITELDEGTHSFTLKVGDKTYSLSITVDKSGSDPDTNKDVLKKLANVISGTDSDIKASVKQKERRVYSPLSDTLRIKVAQLKIEAKDIVEANGFSLSDSDGSIIETLKLDRIAQPSQLSKYTLDTITAETDLNSVSADNNRLSIELLNASRSPVTIKVESGLKPLEKKIAGLIEEYNSYISWLERNRGSIKPATKNDIVKEVEEIERDLSSIGLERNDDGTIKITKRFKTVLESDIDTVRTVLTGNNAFFARVAEKLDTILSNGAQEYLWEPNQSRRLSVIA